MVGHYTEEHSGMKRKRAKTFPFLPQCWTYDDNAACSIAFV